MIALPPGFDLTTFVGELYSAAAPFAGIIWLMVCGAVVFKILKRL